MTAAEDALETIPTGMDRKGPTEPQSAAPITDTLMPDGKTTQSRGVILDP